MQPSEANCPFCLEKVQEEYVVLHMNDYWAHVECKLCMKEWVESFLRQFLYGREPTCPICREDLDKNFCDFQFEPCVCCRSYVPKIYMDVETIVCEEDCKGFREVLWDSSLRLFLF